MTISSQNRKAGPFVGTGATATFPFSFKVFSATDLLVVRLNVATGAETALTLTTDYTVSLNADQNANPGGSITLAAGNLPTGSNLVISSSIGYLQPTDLTNRGGFYPSVITAALDRLTILAQQLKEAVDRSVKVSITSSDNPDSLIAQLTAASIAAVAAADAAAASYDAFDDRYLGSKVADPTLDNDGNALLTGALYFNSVSGAMRVYGGTGWQDIAQGTSTPYQTFSGTGAQVSFSLSGTPGSLGSIEVFVGGVRQVPGINYSLSGATLTFAIAPPSGTNNIFVRWITTQPISVPSDGSVTTAKFDVNAVSPFAAGYRGPARSDVASAATVVLTSANDDARITGTTTITAFTLAAGRIVRLLFGGSLTLTNNANIVTNTGANIVTQPGDTCLIRATAANTVEVLMYTPAALAQQSTRSMVRLTTDNGYGSTNTTIRRYSNVVTNQGTDITYADSATLGASFTVNVAGVYSASITGTFTASDNLGLSVNASVLNGNVAALAAAERLAVATTSTTSPMTVSWTGYLAAGSIVRPHTNAGVSSNASVGQFTIVRLA